MAGCMLSISGALCGEGAQHFRSGSAQHFRSRVLSISGAGFCFEAAGRALPTPELVDAVPFQKVPRGRLGHVAQLGEPPMRGQALALDAETTRLRHDDEAVELQLFVPGAYFLLA